MMPLLYKLFLPSIFIILVGVLINGCSLYTSKISIFKRLSTSIAEQNFLFHTVWKTSVGNGIEGFYSNLHPAYADGVVYAADRRGIVKAIDTNNGREIWSINLAEKSNWFSSFSALLSSGLVISGNHIYIGSEKAQIYSINTIDGSIAWQVHTAGEVISNPVVSNGTILVHTSNGQLQALNESDGKIKWTINLGVPILSLRGESTPAISFGIAIVGNDDGFISAVSILQGQVIWQQRISRTEWKNKIDRLSDIDITPIIEDNLIYALAYNGNFSVLDLHSGHIIWKRELGSVKDFVIDSNFIYLVDQKDRLLALNKKDGSIFWTQNNLLYKLLTAPVIYNGNLVVCDNEGYIYCISIQSGQLLAKQEVDRSGFLTKPIIANYKLIIQAKNGKIYAIVY